MKSDVILGDFHYSYRFNDKNYNILPKYHLEMINVFSKNESAILWEERINSTATHYKQCINIKDKIEKIVNDCGWGNKNSEEKTKNFLKQIIGENTKIIFFWSKHYSVKTVGRVFCEYWSGFCYPSDDGNLILCDNNILIYDEDILYTIKN